MQFVWAMFGILRSFGPKFSGIIFMSPFWKKLQTRLYKWTERKLRIPIRKDIPTLRLGTPYGGWIIPDNFFSTDSVCYLVGAGEDVSFDLALAGRFGCPVHIIDPTPRAVTHVQELIHNLREGNRMPCSTHPEGFYPPYPAETADLLVLHPYGIWKEDTTLKFFAPRNAGHVSHSMVNLQQTEQFIEVPARSLGSMMKMLGHERVHLLKLDIEGAEYEVLDNILSENIPIDVLCIEFDESYANHFDGAYMDRIEQRLKRLVAVGYTLIAKEAHCHNYTLQRL